MLDPTPYPSPKVDPTMPPELLSDESWHIFQTLKRITFGPTEDELARAHEIGLEAFIEEQLDPESIDDSHMDPLLTEFPTLAMSPQELAEIEPPGTPVVELVGATLLRALHSRRQLHELMVDFWTNHFNIYIAGNPERILKTQDDREVIRPHALGNFYDLLSASAHSPAMLTYLDQASSNQQAPNENYARELLELHTMGVDGGYTQLDVEEAARILTGWTVGGFRQGGEAGQFLFADRMHDAGEKTVLGERFPAGGGEDEGQRLLQILAEHPSTAHYLAEKLARRFVADRPPETLVEAAAQTFGQSQGDLKAVMRTILFSPEFQASLGQKFSRPFEYLVAALRTTGAQPVQGRLYGEFLRQMGQPLFQWPTPDGYPDEADAWQSTGGMLARWNYALLVAFGGRRGQGGVDWAGLAGDSGDSESLSRGLWQRLIPDPLTDPVHQVLLDFAQELPQELVAPGLGALILASPYFQYR